jgi:hypothetical protein
VLFTTLDSIGFKAGQSKPLSAHTTGFLVGFGLSLRGHNALFQVLAQQSG